MAYEETTEKVAKIDKENKVLELEEATSIFDLDELNLVDLSKKKCKDDPTKTKEQELEDLLFDDIDKALSLRSQKEAKWRKFEMIAASEPDPRNNNKPWPRAANTRSPIALKTFIGKFVRWISSLFSIDPVCIIEPLSLYQSELEAAQKNIPLGQKQAMIKDIRDIANRIEKYFHHLFVKLMHAVDVYRDILTNVGKVDTGIAVVGWEYLKKKRFINNKTYKNEIEFRSDFPDAKKADISEEDYASILADLKAGNPYTVPKIQKFDTVKNLPYIDNVNRDKFVILPETAYDLELARGYGYEYEKNYNDLKDYEAKKLFRNVDRIITGGIVTGTNQADAKKKQLVGQAETDADADKKKRTYKLYRLIYNYDIDNDGLAEKLIVNYSYEKKVVARVELWDDNLYMIPHRRRKNPGLFDGIGVIRSLEAINDHADMIWNLRVNAAKIICSPAFKGKRGSTFDPTAQEWYPGVIFWLDELNEIEKMEMMNNFPELINEENMLDRYSQEQEGITSGHGGRESPDDPNAPGNKTIALIQEGNLITNEDISCLRESIEEVFYRILQLCAKYLDDDDKYLEIFGITKKDLQVSIDEISLHGVSVSYNKEFRKREDTIFWQTFGNEPIFTTNLENRNRGLKEVFRSWGKNKESLVPSVEETREQMIQIQMEANKRMERERIKQLEEDKVKEANRLIDRGEKPPPPPKKPMSAPTQPQQGGKNERGSRRRKTGQVAASNR